MNSFSRIVSSTVIFMALFAAALLCPLSAHSAANGQQVYMKVTLGDCYEKPVFVYAWFTHYSGDIIYTDLTISKDGVVAGLIEPKRAEALYRNNESTGWVDISPEINPETGALLILTARPAARSFAPRFKADICFAREPNDAGIVKTYRVDAAPGNEYLSIPRDLNPENLPKLRTAEEIAEATGKIADTMRWPTFGKKPLLFPYFVSANPEGAGGFPPDTKITEREQQTLDYFGFANNAKLFILGNTWLSLGTGGNLCYSQPDIEGMKANLNNEVEAFKKTGKSIDDIANYFLTDEVGGQRLSHIVNCPACVAQFRQWMKDLRKTPAELGVANWDEVKPVAETQCDRYPELYYYTEKFRVRAWSKFMRAQREQVLAAYGGNFPVNANSSDGTTMFANSSTLGQDNFELLENENDQNAMFGENWASGAATDQCSSYNVELMRSAAMKRGQTLGHFLISYAGKLPWDIKLNAVSMVARDVKVLSSFYYGPSWLGPMSGPPWNSSAWYAKPEHWNSEAEIVREIGGAEDLLYPAKKKKAEVAILYSFSTDIWSINYAEDKFMPLTADRTASYGFDRMFIWLALTHANIPVDFISENTVAANGLQGYKACYFAGRNLARNAAMQLTDWVKHGGTLVTTAGAGVSDEYNRPLGVLEEILPAGYGRLDVFQPFQSEWNARADILALNLREQVTMAKDGARLAVLSVKQELLPKPGATIAGTFAGGAPAIVMRRAGKGTVTAYGFLPGLAYVWPALVMQQRIADNNRKSADKQTGMPDPSLILSEKDLSRRSSSPWQYPAEVRNAIAGSALRAKVDIPVRCSAPLVDAVCMVTDRGIVVPLANYTLQPLKKVTLAVEVTKPVRRVESVHHGKLPFTQKAGRVQCSLPLVETDFVKLYY